MLLHYSPEHGLTQLPRGEEMSELRFWGLQVLNHATGHCHGNMVRCILSERFRVPADRPSAGHIHVADSAKPLLEVRSEVMQ